MFARRKCLDALPYYYLVTNERSDGCVRQKTLAYLGSSLGLAEALEDLPKAIAKLRAEAAPYAQRADARRQHVHPAWNERNGGEVPLRRYKGLSLRYEVRQQYWQWRELAESHEGRSRKLSARLAKLRTLVESASCSD